MRLIDADALDEKLQALAERYAKQGRIEAADDYNFVATVIMTAPTVDAVEVVRCKDCKHNTGNQGNFVECDYWIDIVKTNGFCSYGERKKT